jgi:hypothetical protein
MLPHEPWPRFQVASAFTAGRLAFREGQVYRCEVTVTKSAPPDCAGTANPTCCCGKEMTKVSD